MQSCVGNSTTGVVFVIETCGLDQRENRNGLHILRVNKSNSFNY